MNKVAKLTLLSAIAAVAVILQVHGANVNQLDSLKAQFLPAEYRNTNFTIDDLKKIYREKCKKAGGVDNATLYQEIEKGAAKLSSCLSAFTNFTAIQAEIETARPIGELDTVFHKYCEKAPEAETCIREFNAKLQPCLTKDERQQNAVMMRIGSALLNFMCSKGGDQIALFVAEQGPECLEANKEAISHCMNSSFAEYLPKDGGMPDVFNLPELVFAPKHCIDFERFEKCTLHHLEQCQEITPANVVESIFRFVKNETTCKAHIEAQANERSVLKSSRSGASTVFTHKGLFTVLFIASYTLLLPKH